MKLLGWDEISQLVKESEKNCPPPMAYNVSGAGSDFVNGRYDIDPKLLSESGYVLNSIQICSIIGISQLIMRTKTLLGRH